MLNKKYLIGNPFHITSLMFSTTVQSYSNAMIEVTTDILQTFR